MVFLGPGLMPSFYQSPFHSSNVLSSILVWCTCSLDTIASYVLWPLPLTRPFMPWPPLVSSPSSSGFFPKGFVRWATAIAELAESILTDTKSVIEELHNIWNLKNYFPNFIFVIKFVLWNKEKIASNGAIPLLVEILRSDNQLGELATASLLSLSASNSNKPDIASSGAIPLLVKILVSGSIQGRVDAVTALFNLFSCIECGVDLFLPVEAVRPLLSLLKDSRKHSKLADKVTALLAILSESEEGRLAIAEVEGGILTIVETIENGSFVGTEHSVSILHALCWNNRERYRELILNEGPIPGLLLLTVEGTKKARSRAHELLDLLRPDSRPKRVPHEELETIGCDSAKRVDGPKKAAETAKRLMQDMVRRNMEANIDKLEQSAATCNLNSPLS
ncbi:hypothetical protein HPP92_021583 [Vanilla planifolia]|uniref:U-box domain-containing protein n=1 Tax=Vanilla planifolia TaxID=51239 RepID=A0A835Q8B2_VANPL|nr:hypothetical protein HPP92_021583 [Vanilla planifolia]